MNETTQLLTQIDVPAAYEQTLATSRLKWVTSIEDLQTVPEKTPWTEANLQKLLTMEEAVLDVSAAEQPEVFLQRRTEFMQASRQELEVMLPEVKQRTVERFSSYFAAGDSIAEDQFRDLFNRRLASVNDVDVSDPLLNTSEGDFQGLSRSILINGLMFLRLAQRTVDRQDYLIDTLLTHEIMHGMFTSARTDGAVSNEFATIDIKSRNGIAITQTPEDGAVKSAKELVTSLNWLNEANLEDMRQRVTESKSTGYRAGVSILRTLKDLDPGIGVELEQYAFDAAAPAPLVGRLEELVGPLGIEKLGELYAEQSKNQKLPDPTVVKNFFVALLPAEKRAEAEYAFDAHYAEHEAWLQLN